MVRPTARRMSRPVATIPRIAFTLSEAATVAGCDVELLKGQIFHGCLRGKRTSRPRWLPPHGLPWGGSRYLVAVDDLASWLVECGDAADVGLWLGWEDR